jgi:hypothetical protein
MGKSWWGAVALGLAVILVGGCETIVTHEDPTSEDPNRPTRVFGSGVVVIESRALESFTTAEARGGSYEVVLELAPTHAVEITADDNLAPLLRTNVREGRLVIAVDPQLRLVPTEPIVLRVSVTEVSELIANGGVLLNADVGAVPQLAIGASGASVVDVTGSAERQVLSISGASVFRGLDLESSESVVIASGVSLAELWAHDHLEVDGSGLSTIRYRGQPVVIARLSGGSTVSPIR